MKKFLGILVLISTLQTPSQADDIKDFQIEGMSIGDSLLDYVSKEFINDDKGNIYPGQDIYTTVLIKKPTFETYDAVQVDLKNNDKKFLIRGLGGFIYYLDNIEDCYSKQKEISLEISKVLKDAVKQIDNGKHPGDETGKSTYSRISFFLKADSNKAEIEIVCFDNSKEYLYDDKMTVVFYSEEFGGFLSKYYK
jgi:hypothetical protein